MGLPLDFPAPGESLKVLPGTLLSIVFIFSNVAWRWDSPEMGKKSGAAQKKTTWVGKEAERRADGPFGQVRWAAGGEVGRDLAWLG